MATLHISEADLARDLDGVLEKVRAGAEVVVEKDHMPVAVIKPPHARSRKVSDILAALDPNSTATVDADFARDVEAAIAWHREPADPPKWD